MHRVPFWQVALFFCCVVIIFLCAERMVAGAIVGLVRGFLGVGGRVGIGDASSGCRGVCGFRCFRFAVMVETLANRVWFGNVGTARCRGSDGEPLERFGDLAHTIVAGLG